MKKKQKFEWTVIFLIRAVADYWKDASQMINEIKSIAIDKDLAILICLNIDAANIPADFPRRKDHPSHGETTLFYRIKKGKRYERGQSYSRLEYIDENKDFKIRRKEDLSHYFKNQILKKYKARKHMVFTWDHGAAFGIFTDGTTDNIKIVNKSSINILTMDDLKQAISWSFGKKKIDILVMMNCNLQLYDSGYSLESVADSLVAPETTMHWNGYNYKSIFKRLSRTPRISGQKIAEEIILSFPFKNDPTTGHPYPQEDVAMFANSLALHKKLGCLISELANRLIQMIPDKLESIKDARQKCRFVDEVHYLIDFFYFIESLRSESDINDIYELLDNIGSFKKRVIIKKYIGSRLKYEKEPPRKGPSSFSFFFPDDSTQMEAVFSRTYFRKTSPDATLFIKESDWYPFLVKYFRAIDES